jgi:hypothetical protein
MRGFGALFAGYCIRAVGALLLITAVLAVILIGAQWLRGDGGNPGQLAFLAAACTGGGLLCHFVGGVFVRLAGRN